MTRYFPELIGPLKANLPSRCVIDGEIILVAASGDRLDFEALQQRIHPAASRVKLLAEQTPARFVALTCWRWGTGTSLHGPSGSGARNWQGRSLTVLRPFT